MNDSHALEEAKKPRVMGDIPMELIDEVMSTITDPAAMLGPEVSRVNKSSPATWQTIFVFLATPALGSRGGIIERERVRLSWFAFNQLFMVWRARQAGGEVIPLDKYHITEKRTNNTTQLKALSPP